MVIVVTLIVELLLVVAVLAELVEMVNFPISMHLQSDVSYQPHESLYFIDPTTQQYIPYSTRSYKTSNTWVNPNNKSENNAQPRAMLTKSNS